MNKILSDLYFDPSNSTAYTGLNKLYAAAKLQDGSIKRKDVKKWLSGNETYSSFFPARQHFKRRSIISYGIDHIWAAVNLRPKKCYMFFPSF
jgi:hypothetical protein